MPHPASPRQLLLVEDDPDLQRLLTLVLTDAGYLIDAAGSAAAARELLLTTRPDLVIADFSLHALPYDALLALIDGDAKTRGTPVLFCTARAPHEVAPLLATRPRAATALLYKPFELTDLLDQVVQLWREPQHA
jgi:DNA-binding response OmpR family regulator